MKGEECWRCHDDFRVTVLQEEDLPKYVFRGRPILAIYLKQQKIPIAAVTIDVENENEESELAKQDIESGLLETRPRKQFWRIVFGLLFILSSAFVFLILFFLVL